MHGESKATNTLFAGIQMILPGEVAPAHRHVSSAIRFVLDGEGAYTAVDGEKSFMSPGDFVITATWARGKPYGLCFNLLASGLLNPPLVLWSLGMFSQALNVFQNASHFAVNVLGASQQALATKFAKSSEEKFAGVEWTPGLGNVPVLADSVASFQCRAANRYYGGDHVIFLGAVEAYSYNRREPLLFARGGYGRFLGADDVSVAPKP
jgi:flavin reductase (DIM6/NTAB) family NADH-FMN oxidoreductase RutF